MNHFTQISELRSLPGPVHLAIGVFDGLHLGHQAVLNCAAEGAKKTGGSCVLVTFAPHPIRVLRPEAVPKLLTPTRHKLLLAKRLGIPNILVLAFDSTFAALTGEEFVQKLTNGCDLAQVCVGADWAFGHQRTGNLPLLLRLGERHGFEASGVHPVQLDNKKISSTRIRASLEDGNLPAAAELLGRSFSLMGKVIQGQQIGRTIGFPTANLDTSNLQLPLNGVYAVRASINSDIPHKAVCNLGVRPTVSSLPQRVLEVHLIDYSGPEFYDSELEIWFEARIRKEMRFDSVEILSSQIQSDVQSAKSLLQD